MQYSKPCVGNGNPLQYSCLENSIDKGAWQAIVHGAAKSDDFARLSDLAHTQESLNNTMEPIHSATGGAESALRSREKT